MVQCCVWIIIALNKKNNNILKKHYVKLIDLMDDSTKHNAIHRNICKLFYEIEIPKIYEGKIIAKSFNIISSDNSEIAAKVFSIHLIMKYKKKYPDLIVELKELISLKLPYFQHSPGLINVARKVMNSGN